MDKLARLETALIAHLREAAPDADQEDWQILNLRSLCDTLRRDSQVDLDPERLTRLLKSFAEAFNNEDGQRAFTKLRPAGIDNRYVKLLHSLKRYRNAVFAAQGSLLRRSHAIGHDGPLERALALFLVVSWRIARLMSLRRTVPDLDAGLLLETEEWQAASLLAKKPVPKDPPHLNEVTRLIADSAGFSGV